MRWRNLEEERDLYYVRETHSRKHGFTTTKTASSEAEVPVPGILLEELREHRKRQAEMRLRKGDKWQDHGLISTTPKGTPMPHNWFCKGTDAEIAERGGGAEGKSAHTAQNGGFDPRESGRRPSRNTGGPTPQEADGNGRLRIRLHGAAPKAHGRGLRSPDPRSPFPSIFPQSSLKVG